MTARTVDTHPAWCIAEPCAAERGGEHRGSTRFVPGPGPLDFTFVDLVKSEGGPTMLRLRRGGRETRYTTRQACTLLQVLRELLAADRKDAEA